MIIEKKQYDKCPACDSSKLVSQDVYGCDQCGKVIDLNQRNVDWLDLVVFYKDLSKETQHLNFCSWKCLFNRLPKIKTDYFINLPYISFGAETSKNCSANAFFKELKFRKKKK